LEFSFYVSQLILYMGAWSTYDQFEVETDYWQLVNVRDRTVDKQVDNKQKNCCGYFFSYQGTVKERRLKVSLTLVLMCSYPINLTISDLFVQHTPFLTMLIRVCLRKAEYICILDDESYKKFIHNVICPMWWDSQWQREVLHSHSFIDSHLATVKEQVSGVFA
jgi:hypothetical protein